MKKIPILIAASSIAVIALFLFQINWLQHSRKLMEEDFSHRVYMALCSAVENHRGDRGTQGLATLNVCGSPTDSQPIDLISGIVENDPSFESSLVDALAFYHIDLDYELTFTQECLNEQSASAIYQCCMNPYNNSQEDRLVNILFPGKSGYIWGKMKFMLLSSFLILFFIIVVFVWANWTLWKQKQITQINIDFFNNMAHEFRTPLTNIGLATSLLYKKEANLKDNNYLKIVQQENRKLMSQVERVLYLAKVENGEYHLQKETVSIHELLKEVTQTMHLQIQARKAIVCMEGVEKNLVLEADKLHLGNVFRNLLDNALKYSGDEPKIIISTKTNEKGVNIYFQDNGIGISNSDQRLVFEKFQRVGKGNVHNQKGFGLGLAYVKLVVELHKGMVRVISDIQKGSRFEVFLPMG